MQKPLANMYLRKIKFPLVGSVNPDIITGLAAFGRSGDLDKIRTYTEMMQLPLTWPEPVQKRTKFDIYSREIAAALSMESPWVMTEDEYKEVLAGEAKASQDAAMQEATVKAAPELLKQGMGQGGAQ